MNTSAEHLAQAEHNEAFYQVLQASAFPSGDWQVTLLFYAALHYVDAYLHQLQPAGVHASGHRERARHVSSHVGANVALDYLELQLRSEDARYNGRRYSDAEVGVLYSAEFTRIRTHVRGALGLPL
jgi:hypothetical protein